MKIVVIICSFCAFLCFCKEGSEAGNGIAPAERVQMAPADTVSFARDVVPLLRTHCSPCHFPGGSMYKKMPFDDSGIIIESGKGITSRLKGTTWGDTIINYIQQSASGNRINTHSTTL